MALLIFKATLLFILALAGLPLMRRTSSAARHLICACAMSGALLLPLTLLAPPQAAPIRLSSITFLATSGTASAETFWPVSRVLAALWIGGTIIFLLRLRIGYRRIAVVIRTATPEDGFAYSDVSVPMVAGLLRPVILMPHCAECWPMPQRDAALQHELAHVKRKDLWTSLIGQLTCAVYWFHPLAWTVSRHMRREQEAACDDAVLYAGFEPASYAEALIATARQMTSTSFMGCQMTQKTLKTRIARLFEDGMPRMSSTTTLRNAAVGFATLAAMIALLNGNPRARAADEQRAPAPTASQDHNGPANHPYQMGEGITPPRVLSKVDPAYTDDAKAAKISGPVQLSIVVGTDGLAYDIAVVSGLDAGLDRNAVDAIKEWRFQPATKDGQPIAVRAKIEMNFRLL